mgnify:CR=1 FL=1
MSRKDYTKGDLTLYGNMSIESSDIWDGRLESVFGDKDSSISFGELISKISKAGIEPQKITDAIKVASEDFLQKWLENSNHNDYWSKAELNDFEVTDVRVTWQFVELYFKSYCKFDIYEDIDNYNDWDKFSENLNKAADETMKHSCLETSYNDYEFITGIDDGVEIEYDGSPATPPVYDEHDAVLYNEWYG